MESQSQASHPFHRPWESRENGGIPTFPLLRRLFLFYKVRQKTCSSTLAKGWAKLNCRSGPKSVAKSMSLATVENALTLAVARRSARPVDAVPLGTIRSLAYFAPVIDEVLQLKVGPEYFQHLRNKLRRSTPAR